MAATLAALTIIEREPERREKLWKNTKYMNAELQLLGFETGNSGSPIIPIVIGDDLTTFVLVKRLQEEGVFANPVISPAGPAGGAMIRTSYMATHEREHLDQALSALEKVALEVGVL